MDTMSVIEEVNQSLMKFDLCSLQHVDSIELTNEILEQSKALLEEQQKEFFLEILKTFQKQYGGKSVEVALIRSNLGQIEVMLGNYTEGRSMLEESVRTFATYKDHTLDMAEALTRLSVAWIFLMNPKKATEYLEKALPIVQRQFALKPTPKAAEVLFSIGVAFGDLGRYEMQKNLLEQALPCLQEHLGEESVEFSIKLASVAAVYVFLDNPSRARELLNKALPAIEASFRPVSCVGKCIKVSPSSSSSSPSYSPSVVVQPITDDQSDSGFTYPERPDIADALVNFGVVYGALGQTDREIELLERAVSYYEASYGEEHSKVSVTLTNLAFAYGSKGNQNKEKDILERVLVLNQAIFGEEHSEVAKTLTHLAAVNGSLGDHCRKKELLELALPILEKTYGGRDHVEIAEVLACLASAYRDLEDRYTEIKLLEDALFIFETHHSARHLQTAETRVNLAFAYGSVGETGKELHFLKQALPVVEGHYGPKHHMVAVIKNAIAAAEAKSGKKFKFYLCCC